MSRLIHVHPGDSALPSLTLRGVGLTSWHGRARGGLDGCGSRCAFRRGFPLPIFGTFDSLVTPTSAVIRTLARSRSRSGSAQPAEPRGPPSITTGIAALRPVVWLCRRWVWMRRAGIVDGDEIAVALIEVGGGLEHHRNVFGAVQIDRARLGVLQSPQLADRRVAQLIAIPLGGFRLDFKALGVKPASGAGRPISAALRRWREHRSPAADRSATRRRCGCV